MLQALRVEKLNYQTKNMELYISAIALRIFKAFIPYIMDVSIYFYSL